MILFWIIDLKVKEFLKFKIFLMLRDICVNNVNICIIYKMVINNLDWEIKMCYRNKFDYLEY